jgi:hypothetical protein
MLRRRFLCGGCFETEDLMFDGSNLFEKILILIEREIKK